MRGNPRPTPHPPSASALGPSSPAVRERSCTVVGYSPIPHCGEGAERGEAGEGSLVSTREN